jgi:hypothetical protein
MDTIYSLFKFLDIISAIINCMTNVYTYHTG